jgi:hypothetical protein
MYILLIPSWGVNAIWFVIGVIVGAVGLTYWHLREALKQKHEFDEADIYIDPYDLHPLDRPKMKKVK